MAVSSVRDIAQRFGLSKSSVDVHRRRHLQAAAARLAKRRETLGAEALLDKLQDLFDAAEAGMEKARADGDLTGLARCIKEARECLVRLGQATRGLWSTSPQTVIDNRRQTIAIGQLTVDELRSLARLTGDEASSPSQLPRAASSSDASAEPLALP